MADPIASSSSDDIVKLYGLEPHPDNVVELTRLVTQKEVVVDQIAKVVAKDKALTAHLLRFANPRAESVHDYNITTVEGALTRVGMAPVILLAMLDPLTRAVIKAFEMFRLPLVPASVQKLAPLSGPHVLGVVEFSGKATGVVYLRLEPTVAQRLAAAIIGGRPEELTDPSAINDVIGELVNIVAGNIKSNLCDAGITCTLGVPQVSRTADFKIKTVAGGVSERLGFAAADLRAFVDVSVNPWNR
jgi:chemotaxis protein CheX